MCSCKQCGNGNVIWTDISQVETDCGEVTMVVSGHCEDCRAEHYAIVGGTIELGDSNDA